MRDSVKARTYISFENPFGPVVSTEGYVTRFYGVCRRAALSESIGVRVSRGFGDRIESKQVESLHGPILHGGNSEFSHLSIRFWYELLPYWFEAKLLGTHLLDGLSNGSE